MSSFSYGSRFPLLPHDISTVQIKSSIKVDFMTFLNTTNIRNYTKYLTLFIWFVSSNCSISASDLNFLNRSQKIKISQHFQESEMPFTNEAGYISGGKHFDYAITDEFGKKHYIADFKGNVLIIVFSTTWCPNCPSVLKEFNYLVNEFQRLNIKNVKIIVLNIGSDSINTLKAYYKNYDMAMLNAYESIPNKAISGIRGVPACLIFDKSGSPVWGYVGAGADYQSPEFINFIKKLAD
jgi:thiol-disulfide isomerase/thioredoxin